MLKHITGVIVIGLTLAAPIAAQTAQKPDARTAKPKIQMAQRLRDGIRSGQLTRGELGTIRLRLQAFRAEVKQLRSSGTVSREARVALRRQWRQISRLVFQAKHNRIRRGGGA